MNTCKQDNTHARARTTPLWARKQASFGACAPCRRTPAAWPERPPLGGPTKKVRTAAPAAPHQALERRGGGRASTVRTAARIPASTNACSRAVVLARYGLAEEVGMAGVSLASQEGVLARVDRGNGSGVPLRRGGDSPGRDRQSGELYQGWARARAPPPKTGQSECVQARQHKSTNTRMINPPQSGPRRFAAGSPVGTSESYPPTTTRSSTKTAKTVEHETTHARARTNHLCARKQAIVAWRLRAM